MSAEMDQLKLDVAAETTVAGSVIAYIQGLAPMIADAAGDRAASVALSKEVKDTAAAMLAAIHTNTPPTPLADSFPDRASFDAGVAADTNPEPIRLDGIEVKAGTGAPRDRYTHSDQGGVIDSTAPTS